MNSDFFFFPARFQVLQSPWFPQSELPEPIPLQVRPEQEYSVSLFDAFTLLHFGFLTRPSPSETPTTAVNT